MYKLDPSEFKTEDDVQKLISFLESSPFNRQAVPNAGQKIGSYYRRLAKRPGKSAPAFLFLVREDKVHDEMLKALQRLLREKELDFDGYNMTLAELKRFVGMEPEASLFYGEHEVSELGGADDEEAEEEGSQKSSKTATPSRDGIPFSKRSQSVRPSDSAAAQEKEKPQDKDVLLMQKGLTPLAALDVIPGWMLLEMATSGEEERRLIRAATCNKLGYFDIKSALLSMYEERHQRTPFQGHRGEGKPAVFAAELEPGWEDFEEQPDPAASSSYDETNLYGTVDNAEWSDGWAAWHGTMRVGRNGQNRHPMRMRVAVRRLNTKRRSITFIKNKKRLRESSMSCRLSQLRVRGHWRRQDELSLWRQEIVGGINHPSKDSFDQRQCVQRAEARAMVANPMDIQEKERCF